jgi:hypothetical protein
VLDRPLSTVSGILTRIGMGKLGRLGLEPAQRYGAIYASSRERTAAPDGWLWTYNHRRRHSAIGRQPPISRLNNLLGTYS